jgi:hypothetical protein
LGSVGLGGCLRGGPIGNDGHGDLRLVGIGGKGCGALRLDGTWRLGRQHAWEERHADGKGGDSEARAHDAIP